MNDFKSLIADGELDLNKVHAEIINEFTNVNKKPIYRFYINNDRTRSYIFKSANTAAEIIKELWVHVHFRPLIPDVYIPSILDYCVNEITNEYWMVSEDAGPLNHTYSEDLLLRAALAIVCWHKLPTTTSISRSDSYLPYIDDARQQILNNEAQYRRLLGNLNISKSLIDNGFLQLRAVGGTFPTEKVISHGDYLVVNIAQNGERLVVLDWEFLQINSVYFDLFTLMDMAVVRYRIRPTKQIRKRVLEAYIAERETTGWVAPEHFMKNYHLFVLIYSLLTLPWLFGDLEEGRFDRALLLSEKEELAQIIQDCLEFIEQPGEPHH